MLCQPTLSFTLVQMHIYDAKTGNLLPLPAHLIHQLPSLTTNASFLQPLNKHSSVIFHQLVLYETSEFDTNIDPNLLWQAIEQQHQIMRAISNPNSITDPSIHAQSNALVSSIVQQGQFLFLSGFLIWSPKQIWIFIVCCVVSIQMIARICRYMSFTTIFNSLVDMAVCVRTVTRRKQSQDQLRQPNSLPTVTFHSRPHTPPEISVNHTGTVKVAQKPITLSTSHVDIVYNLPVCYHTHLTWHVLTILPTIAYYVMLHTSYDTIDLTR